MKNLLSLVFAGMIGGLVAFGAFNYNNTNTGVEATVSSKASQVSNFNSSPASSSLPSDFIVASEKATNAVVHIYAEEDEKLAAQRFRQNRQQRQSRDPFSGFFNMDDFFGSNFYQPKNGTGSGVIVSNDGYIVTNNHVVGFADYIQVTLSDGRKMEAKRIGTDESTDLAVLKIEAKGLTKIEFSNSDHVRVGEWVLAVGNPFNLTSTVTAGIVSAKGRDIDIIKADKSIEEFIQTDAAVNPGNSGGALVNTKGNLVGINTAIATPTGVYAGYSFAIPSNIVRRIVDDIMENGSIERTNLGVIVIDIDKEFQKEMGLSVDKGVFVDEVLKRSTAQYAGILPGDIIVGINKKKVNNFDDVVEEMKYSKVGDMLYINIIRAGKKKNLPVRLRKGI